MYAKDSIDLLTNCGIQFKKHEDDGIEMNDFAELLMTSGVVLSDSVKWISFHRSWMNLNEFYNLYILSVKPEGQTEGCIFRRSMAFNALGNRNLGSNLGPLYAVDWSHKWTAQNCIAYKQIKPRSKYYTCCHENMICDA